MANQQGSGSSLLTIAAGLLKKKIILYGIPIFGLIFLLPMCAAMVAVDNTNPPYKEKEIIIFQEVGEEQEVFFVDLMVYHTVVTQGKVTKGHIKQIAKKFKYTVTRKVKKTDKDGNVTYKTVKEERTYTLQEMLERSSITAADTEKALALGMVWAAKFGQLGDIGELPDGYVIPNSQFIWPVPKLTEVTSRYGYRWGQPHYGVDISGKNAFGSPVVAIASGKVTQIKYDPSNACGLYVRIKHDGGYESRYCHLSAFNVEEGDKVAKGQVIAAVGNTGQSTGPHLHLEMKKSGGIFDPLPYIIGTKP